MSDSIDRLRLRKELTRIQNEMDNEVLSGSSLTPLDSKQASNRDAGRAYVSADRSLVVRTSAAGASQCHALFTSWQQAIFTMLALVLATYALGVVINNRREIVKFLSDGWKSVTGWVAAHTPVAFVKSASAKK